MTQQDGKRGWYRQIGLSKEVFTKLSSLKAEVERRIGVPLSWNKFFILHLRELEAHKR